MELESTGLNQLFTQTNKQELDKDLEAEKAKKEFRGILDEFEREQRNIPANPLNDDLDLLVKRFNGSKEDITSALSEYINDKGNELKQKYPNKVPESEIDVLTNTITDTLTKLGVAKDSNLGGVVKAQEKLQQQVKSVVKDACGTKGFGEKALETIKEWGSSIKRFCSSIQRNKTKALGVKFGREKSETTEFVDKIKNSLQSQKTKSLDRVNDNQQNNSQFRKSNSSVSFNL